ncbi:MAG: hypothetical protein ACK4SX_04325 [Alcanivoracaceae bacterium]
MQFPLRMTALIISTVAIALVGCGGGGGKKRTPPIEPPVILSGSWQYKQMLDVDTHGVQPGLALNDAGEVALIWNRVNTHGDYKCVGADTFSVSEANWNRTPGYVECSENQAMIAPIAISTASRRAAAWVSQGSSGPGFARVVDLATNTGSDRRIWRDNNIDVAPLLLATASGGTEGAVVWEQTSGSSFGYYENIWMVRHSDLDGWSDTIIDLNYQGGTGTYPHRNRSPAIHMNSAGVSLLIWNLSEGYYSNDPPPQLQAMLYAPATSELHPARTYAHIRAYNDVNEVPLNRVAWVDEQGNATLVWVQNTPEENTKALRYRRFNNGQESWSEMAMLDSVTIGNITNVRIHGDADGNLLLVWERIAEQHEELYALFDASTASWSATTLFGPGDLQQVQLGGDSQGNAVLIGVQANNDIVARRYDATVRTWASAEVVHEGSQLANLTMRSNARGETVVAWDEPADVDRRVWTVRLTATAPDV